MCIRDRVYYVFAKNVTCTFEAGVGGRKVTEEVHVDKLKLVCQNRKGVLDRPPPN